MAIEKLQAGEGILSIIPMVGGILLLIVFFFLLSVFFTRNKMVLVKDND